MHAVLKAGFPDENNKQSPGSVPMVVLVHWTEHGMGQMLTDVPAQQLHFIKALEPVCGGVLALDG